MSEDEFKIDDMALDEESKEKKEDLDMGLEAPVPSAIESRIAKQFPNEEIIYLDLNNVLTKKEDGKYKFNSAYLEDLDEEGLNKIDGFLKSKGG